MEKQASKLPKKNKKSVFADDDFFVIKRTKKHKSVESPELPEPIELFQKSKHILSQEQHLSNHTSPDEDILFYSADEQMEPHYSVESFLTIPRIPLTRSRVTPTLLSLLRPKNTDLAGLDGEDDSDLKDFFSHINSKEHEDDEVNRRYRVKVISKIRPFHITEREIRGNYTFSKLMDTLLINRLRSDDAMKSAGLVWVEGRTVLKPYFKPSTLRIAPPADGSITKITCLYIPTENMAVFQTIYPEFRASTDSTLKADVLVVEIVDVSEDDYSVDNSDSGKNSDESKSASFFVIGLKGKDNKRIEVEVSSQTTIRKLLEYYLNKKEVDATAVKNPRLVFDSEVLSLDDAVGDTELEEGFEVEVYL